MGLGWGLNIYVFCFCFLKTPQQVQTCIFVRGPNPRGTFDSMTLTLWSGSYLGWAWWFLIKTESSVKTEWKMQHKTSKYVLGFFSKVLMEMIETLQMVSLVTCVLLNVRNALWNVRRPDHSGWSLPDLVHTFLRKSSTCLAWQWAGEGESSVQIHRHKFLNLVRGNGTHWLIPTCCEWYRTADAKRFEADQEYESHFKKK